MLEIIKKIFNPGQSTSPAKSIDTVDMTKIVRDTLIAAASAGLTVLVNYEGQLNLGQYTVLLAPVIHFVLTAALKWLKDNSEVK